MSGSSLRDMKKILLDLINSLPESFELNILAFDDNYTKLFNSPSKLTEKNKNKALKFVENLQAGGGIVADSKVDYEYEETLNKMMALIKSVDDAERNLK